MPLASVKQSASVHLPESVGYQAMYGSLYSVRGMASVMKTHGFEGIRYEFVPGDDIVPYLAPHESRRLFGGAEGPVHTHTNDRYVAIEAETGRPYGRAPVRGHAHPHDPPE